MYLQIIWKQKGLFDNELFYFSSLRIIYISHFIKIEMYILVVCSKVKGVIIFSLFFTRHFYYQFVKQQL